MENNNTIIKRTDNNDYGCSSEFEHEYAKLVQKIMMTGDVTRNRTGIDTITQFGNNTLSHYCPAVDVDDDTIYAIVNRHGKKVDANSLHYPSLYRKAYNITHCPILVKRPIKFDVAWYETLMMLQGITDTTYLEDRGISIWKGNTTREFLDNRGLYDTPEKDLGKGYGYQWRNWNGRTDQLENIIHQMIQNPMSRRHVVSAWNPEENPEAALDPCHILYQFNVHQGIDGHNDVDIQFYMRSNDVVFGLPFNMLSYYLILCHVCNYLTTVTNEVWNPRWVHYVGANSHVYDNQVEFAREYINRLNGRDYLMESMSDDDDLGWEPMLCMNRAAGPLNPHTFTFNRYLQFIEDFGYTLLYTPDEPLKTPRPKMAV